MNPPVEPSVSGQQSRQRPRPRLSPSPKAPLREQVREVMRFLHFSQRTEESYWQWIVRYLRFHRSKTRPSQGPTEAAVQREPAEAGTTSVDGWRHPREMGAGEVAAFLTHLAAKLDLSAASQNQALNALVFLYGEVLHLPLGEIGDFLRVRRPARLPEVLSRSEVARVLGLVEADYRLSLNLLYGSGLRLMELLRLRVKDLDLERRQITVRNGVTVLRPIYWRRERIFGRCRICWGTKMWQRRSFTPTSCRSRASGCAVRWMGEGVGTVPTHA